MRIVVFLSILLICVVTLADTTDIAPPVPSSVQGKPKVMLPESLLTPPALQQIEGKKKVMPEESFPIAPTPFPVRKKLKNIPEDEMLGVPSFQPVQSLEPTAPPFEPLQAPSLNDVSLPQIAELNDFRGGLYLDVFLTHIPKDGAVKLINALWNPKGEVYTRPGYSEHSVPPFIPNFLYAFYTQAGKKYTMGGSDTALYFWHEDSSGDGWTYLIGTEGTEGRWDGTTFENWFVATHEGIRPIKFNGSAISYLGEASYMYDSSWANSCTLWVHVKDVAWDDDELRAMYAVQDSPAYQDGGRCFGKIIDNTLDAFAIDYNAQSGSNLWTPDAGVTLISALNDSIWVGGIIDTFYSEAFEGEILKPSVDTIVSQWSTMPDTLTNHWLAIWFPSYFGYLYSQDTTEKEMIGFSDHTSSLTSVEKIKITFWAVTACQAQANLDLRVCIGDTTVSWGRIFAIEAYGTEPPYPDYFEYYFVMDRDPRGNVWTTDVLDSLVIYFRKYSSGTGFPSSEIRIQWMQIEVTYEEFELDCAVAIFDSSLFDTLLTSPIDIPTIFEWIPQDYPDTGVAGRERREILTTGQGIIGTHRYLLISLPEIPDLAVGDSFNLRRIYFTTAKFVEVFGDRLWLGQTGSGVDLLKNNIIYSNLNSLSNFPHENYILIESGVGDEITGMKTFPTEFMDVPQYELNVFQNNAFYKILPDFTAGIYAPKLYLIADGVGCVSNSAISPAEGKFLIFAGQHGVWAYDKNEPILISKLIDPIFEEWNPSEYVSGIYNPQDRHYYMSYPDTTVPDDTTTYCVITWEDDREGDWNIYGQRFNYEMVKIDTNFRVDDDIGGNANQNVPDIAVTPQHQFIMAWQDTRAGANGNIRMRRFESDGSAIDTSIVVNGDTTNVQNMPHLDVNSEGKIVVVWEDRRDGTPYDIYAQRYDSSMSAIGSNFLVDSSTSSCWEPHVKIADDGKFVINWFATNENVYFQRYDSAGNAIDTNMAICDSVGDSLRIGIHVDIGMEVDDGDFVNAWEQRMHSIYLEAVRTWAGLRDSAGSAKGADFPVGDFTDTSQEHSTVAMNRSGNFVRCWDDFRVPYVGNTFCQRFNANGNALGGNMAISDTTSGGTDSKYNDVDIDELGNFVVAWTDYDTPDDTTNLFMRAYTGQGKARCGITQVNDRRSEGQVTEECAVAIDKYLELISVVNNKTLAWSMDHHGWSRETVVASAYCYQHSITDDVKILFADAEGAYVCYYGTQADDLTDPVIFTYQSPYFRFSPYPWQRALISYASIESYSDSGTVILSWYSDYGTLIAEDTLTISGYDLQTIDQNGLIEGENISLKITTSADLFKLAGYYLEYVIDKSRR